MVAGMSRIPHRKPRSARALARDRALLLADGQQPLDFAPARVQPRHDGWHAEVQRAFIEALADTGCVATACRMVGRSDSGAYALRRRPDADDFRRAWDLALDQARRRLVDTAMSRAIHGWTTPVFYRGEQVGERRHYDNRLLLRLIDAKRD